MADQQFDENRNITRPSFVLPSESMIFFDWDDTLFPTTYLLDHCGFTVTGGDTESYTQQQEIRINEWKVALVAYIKEACALSHGVFIVTNSARLWVNMCVERFAPELRDIFDGDGSAGKPKIVYALDCLSTVKNKSKNLWSGRPVRAQSLYSTKEEECEALTYAKYLAMRKEVTAFYSQYPQQTWKNILCLGDMWYEHDAIQEVTFRWVPPGSEEDVRTKAIVLPTRPTLSEITSRMKFSRVMLKAYLAHDGDIDLDLRNADDPLKAISDALGVPSLLEVPLSRHAWGREQTPLEDPSINLTKVERAISSKLII